LGYVYFRELSLEKAEFERSMALESEKNTALLRNASDGIHILDYDGNVIEASDSFCVMLGYTRAEVIGMNVSQWDAEFKGDELKKVVHQQFENPVRVQFKTRHRRKDGSIFDVEVSGYPLELNGKSVLFNSSRDITTRKQAEDGLRESESRFRIMANSAPVLIWIAGLDKGCHWFNDVWLNFTGRTLEQEFGNGWAEGVHPDDFDRCLEIYHSHFNRREAFRMEYRLRRHDGEYRWIDDNGVPLLDDDGNFSGFIGSCIDIHEGKQIQEERERLLAIIEEAPDFIATSDMQAHLKYLNKAGARLVGLPEDVDLSPLEIKDMHPAWATKRVLEEGVPTVLRQGFWQGETALLGGDGLEIPVSQLLMVHRDKFGQPELLSTIMRDISASKAIENELRIAAIVFETQEGMTITDCNGLILRVNKAYTAITGYTQAEVIGKNPRIIQSGRHDKEFYISMWTSINSTGEWEGEIWNRRKSGEVYPEYMCITAVKDSAGILTNYVATFTDITKRKELEEAVLQLAFYDTLTKLPNRRLLNDRLRQARSANKRSKVYGALMFLDLDNFKPLNDTHGHAVGDLLLIETARRLESCIREMDTVARFGGDEFVVMLSELDQDQLTSKTQAENVAEKIRESISEPFLLKVTNDDLSEATVEHHCTVSIGLTLFNGLEVNQEEVLKQADAAMYQTKAAGRNQIRFYGGES
jgi:diguanylate cyclase (GGDEF)-like protein/PAS domain S-box-containing protein